MATYLGLGLDDGHDLHVDGDGNLVVVEDTEAVAELTRQHLMTYLGEWFLDTTVGVPWFQRVFVRPFNEMVTEAVIKRAILRTLGVVELMSFEMAVRWERRQIEVLRADVRTEFDEIVELSL